MTLTACFHDQGIFETMHELLVQLIITIFISNHIEIIYAISAAVVSSHFVSILLTWVHFACVVYKRYNDETSENVWIILDDSLNNLKDIFTFMSLFSDTIYKLSFVFFPYFLVRNEQEIWNKDGKRKHKYCILCGRILHEELVSCYFLSVLNMTVFNWQYYSIHAPQFFLR